MRSARRSRSYSRRGNRARSRSRSRRGNRARGRSRSRSNRRRSESPRGRRRSRERAEPKSRQSLFDEPPAPQADASTPTQVTPGQLSYADVSRNYLSVKIPHKAVGVVIGPQGQALKSCEIQTGCSISISQATKSQGYSVAHISGPSSLATERAVAYVEERIRVWENHPGRRVGEGASEEFQIDQRMVGIILGKGGDNLRQMMQQSNTNIKLDQSQKMAGVCVVKIDGDAEAVAQAKKLVQAKMMEVAIKEGALEQQNIRIEQTHVPMFVGRNGENIEQVKIRSGADLLVDQTTKDQGYSTIRIAVGPGSDVAYKLVMEKLDEIKAFKNKPSQIRKSIQSNQTPLPSQPIPGVFEPGDWLCPQCSNLNFKRRQVCNKCGAAQPEKSTGFENHTRWPPQPPQESFEPGDWHCNYCNNLNFRRRLVCNKCGEPKPDDYSGHSAGSQQNAHMQPQGAAYGQPTSSMHFQEAAYGQPPASMQPPPSMHFQEAAYGQPPASMQPPPSMHFQEAAFGQPAVYDPMQSSEVLDMKPHEYLNSWIEGNGAPGSMQSTGEATHGHPLGIDFGQPTVPQQVPVGPIEEAYRIDQRWVAWVKGKDGETLRKILAQTGASASVDPDPNDKGASILRVKDAASQNARRAIQMITQKIQECMNMPMIRSMLGDTLPPPMVKISQDFAN